MNELEASFERITSAAPDVALRFYDELFTCRPDFRPLFPAEVAGQAAKLRYTVELLATRGVSREELETLGRRHHDLGVSADDYAVVRDILLKVFSSCDDEWSLQLAAAWGAALDDACAAMLQPMAG